MWACRAPWKRSRGHARPTDSTRPCSRWNGHQTDSGLNQHLQTGTGQVDGSSGFVLPDHLNAAAQPRVAKVQPQILWKNASDCRREVCDVGPDTLFKDLQAEQMKCRISITGFNMKRSSSRRFAWRPQSQIDRELFAPRARFAKQGSSAAFFPVIGFYFAGVKR
jgi:hypothetical protein